MNIAIILSGGTGVRLGGNIPKQYIEVNEKPIIADCIETFEGHADIDGYIIVAAAEWEDYIKGFVGKKFMRFASPGENRQLSIYSGMKAVKEIVSAAANGDGTSDSECVVIIHDAARPFVTKEMISELINACDFCDGAMPALPVKDTMYIQENGKVKALIDRESLIGGQAPEAFKFDKYLAANEALLPDKILNIKGSTEPAFLAGMDIAVIKGDEKNFKITTKEDLEKYKMIKKSI